MLLFHQSLPQFRYNVESQRYVASNGRYVAREAVEASVRTVANQARQDMLDAAGRFQRGEIAHSEFQDVLRLSSRRAIIAESIHAAGGIEQMTPAKWGRAGALIREQYNYANGLGERVESGHYGADLQANGFLRDVGLYGLAPRQAYQYMQAQNALIDLGHDEVSNEYGGTEQHCEGEGSCRQMSDLDWIAVDSDTFRNVWRWPGNRLCITHCGCRAKTRKSLANQ